MSRSNLMPSSEAGWTHWVSHATDKTEWEALLVILLFRSSYCWRPAISNLAWLLSKTALDRCNAGEIPGFRIRHYNMGGVRGYKLPTSDILGGIVFESGPRSWTDFDVITEFRVGPSQRINKLHQSYMSLQFPLLFVFGQRGFYPELTLKPRSGLSSGVKGCINNTLLPYSVQSNKTVLTTYGSIKMNFDQTTYRDAPQIDEYISVEIPHPVEDPKGYKLVTELMLQHGPCGAVNLGPDRILAKISSSETSTSAPGDIGSKLTKSKTTWMVASHLTYLNFPSGSAWYPNLKQWKRRQIRTKKSLGRLIYVHPSSGDLFYFRMLLCHQKGCKSPAEVHTVNSHILLTNRAACEALGLLGDEKEWDITLQESTASATSNEVRILFAQILIYCDVSDPSKLLWTAGSYRDLLRQDADQLVPKLNQDQRKIYDLIIDASATNQQELLFVYGHGGIGKDISLENDYKFTSVPRTLRDLMNAPEILFGRNTIVLGGDFRHTVPVKKGVGKEELIAASIAESYLWWHFKIYTLKENMQLLKTRRRRCSRQDAQDSSWISIPPVSADETGLSQLINFIYDEPTLNTPTAGALQEKAIICPKNNTADIVNAKILLNIQGRSRTYLSRNEAIPASKETSETDLLYPMEYLNTITFPGFPPYELDLKVRSSIMLLQNVNL
ncbi:DNA helicase [Tanacetum coccineum]